MLITNYITLMRKSIVLVLVSMFAGYVCAQDYCLENEAVHRYLTEFSYDTIPDYEVSYIMDYFNIGKEGGYRLDAPAPVTVSWTRQTGLTTERIEVSESDDYSNPFVYIAPNNAESYDIYNLIPGRTYYYRVVSADTVQEHVVGTGSFSTNGSLRMIYAEGAWNIRDMGGWISGLNGKPIAYGKIYRGGQLKAKGQDSVLLSYAGIEAMRMIGIRAELDLRSRDNCPVDGSALAKPDAGGRDDVDFLLVPESVNARMYHFQNNDANIRELQWIINRLKQNKPVYFHCQNGADRTGTLGFLIGALLGVSEGDLAKDYELTTFCQEAAVKYDPTEEGFARLRNYTGKMGSPLGSSEDNKEYMFAELANTMKTVAPVNGTYQQKIYNFFRTGVNGTKISPEDLSWFIMEMTGYPYLGGVDCGVDSLILEPGQTYQIVPKVFPEGAVFNCLTYSSTSNGIATVSDDGTVKAIDGGEAYIIVNVDGLEKFIPVKVSYDDRRIHTYSYYNKAVSRYLGETNYSTDEYTISTISKYDTIDLGYGRHDWPESFQIKWVPYVSATNQHLSICATPDFTNCVIDVDLADADSAYRIEDLEPQCTYYYRVTAGFADGITRTVCASRFHIISSVKMIKRQELYNFRDLGGWTGMDGYRVKYGIIYRGSRIRGDLDEGAKIITAEATYLNQTMKINAELDLRNETTETSTTTTTSAMGRRAALYKKVPTAQDCLGENILSGDAYIVAMNTIIGWLKSNKRIYMSASLGAERTGAMAFLINGLLGVDEDGLSKDYELSSFSEDSKAAGLEFKRNEGNFPAMVSKIKTLEGTSLQMKIFNYFKDGVNGTSVPADDLKWFICYMLDYPEDEFAKTELSVKERKRPIKPRIYSTAGYEVDEATDGLYIIDGNTYLINH